MTRGRLNHTSLRVDKGMSYESRITSLSCIVGVKRERKMEEVSFAAVTCIWMVTQPSYPPLLGRSVRDAAFRNSYIG